MKISNLRVASATTFATGIGFMRAEHSESRPNFTVEVFNDKEVEIWRIFRAVVSHFMRCYYFFLRRGSDVILVEYSFNLTDDTFECSVFKDVKDFNVDIFISTIEEDLLGRQDPQELENVSRIIMEATEESVVS